MKDKDYEDGYKEGVSFAEQDFCRWEEGVPPSPWPRMASDVQGFVENSLRMMRIIFSQNIAEDALKEGMDPKYIPYIPIPRALIEGQDNGYRARLTELLNKFVNLYRTSSPVYERTLIGKWQRTRIEERKGKGFAIRFLLGKVFGICAITFKEDKTFVGEYPFPSRMRYPGTYRFIDQTHIMLIPALEEKEIEMELINDELNINRHYFKKVR
ncbi:MAG: hypothetical protein AABZ00_03840 [Chloroflexota bacterium]